MALEKKTYWDVIAIRRDGNWVGFRAPIQALTSLGVWVGVLAVVSVISTSAFVYSQWRLGRLERQIREFRLNSMAGNSMQNIATPTVVLSGTESVSSPEISTAVSFMPQLNREQSSLDVEIRSPQVDWQRAGRKLSLAFDLVRPGTSSRVSGRASVDYRWILALHTPRQIHVFPDVLQFENASLFQVEKAELVKDVSGSKKVKAEYQIPASWDDRALGPLSATLLVYAENGTLLATRMLEVSDRR